MKPKIPDLDSKRLKGFLKRKTRSLVPSPYEGDQQVIVQSVTRDSWTFQSKERGICVKKFEDMTQEEFDRVLS